MPLEIPGIDADELEHSKVLEEPLARGTTREGVMLHYDASASDTASLAWFKHPDCKNGYTWLVMDDGRLIELADPGKRTPHAGKCRTAAANSVFYGLCVATNATTRATPQQLDRVVAVCVALFRHHGWPAADVDRRIRGHHEERVYTPADTKNRRLWGQLGAKRDPIGKDPHQPVLDPIVVRRLVSLELGRSDQ